MEALSPQLVLSCIDVRNIVWGARSESRASSIRGCGLWVAGRDASVDGFPDFLQGTEAGAPQGPPAQDAEPALDLVEPVGVRGREV